MTVGFGFSPNLLTFRLAAEALAGSPDIPPEYRRWGITPRPEKQA